jgi:hypothetical protein
MTNKEKYRILCTNELSIPLYSRDWWLDCVCGEKDWDVLLYEQEEKIEASMPFYSPCKGVITMPPYAQTLGIWFNPAFEGIKYSKNIQRKQLICDYFIERLPPHRYFLQNFHYSFTDWLPFYWKGYRQTTRYNYILPDISDLIESEKKLGRGARNSLHHARDKYHLVVKKNVSADSFMEIVIQTYERQGLRVYEPEVLRKLIDLSISRNQGDIWGAYDENGQLHAAEFIVWQDSCAYVIAGGNKMELKRSGGKALAMWEAICDVSKVSASFDFEGSMLKGVEFFFREFGAIQKPYFSISKGKISLSRKIIRIIQKSKKIFI